jgi:Fic family protein
MPFQHNKPFNALPKLPPKASIESQRILKRAASARGALGELKGLGKLLPNETILLNTLILEEARDSSEIENIVTTRDKLYRALVSGSKNVDPATKEVLRYRSALWKGFGLVQEKGFISTNMIVDIQKELIENDAGVRKLSGTKLANAKTGKVIYTPPEGEGIIRELLGNFETFLNGQADLDPLITMAVLHYQFEAIHPFYDGNGRTGRIVNVLYLVLRGLLDLPILYVSSFIINRKADYYRLLLRVTTHGGWEPWIMFMLEAVEATAIDTVKKVNAIRDSLEETIQEVKEKLPRIYTKELVELLFHQPYSKVAFLVDADFAERKAAARYLNALEGIGVLKAKKVGKERIFLNQRLFELFSPKSKP